MARCRITQAAAARPQALVRLDVDTMTDGWASKQFEQQAKLKQIVRNFLNRESERQKLQDALRSELEHTEACGSCVTTTHWDSNCHGCLTAGTATVVGAMVLFFVLRPRAVGRSVAAS